MSTERKYRAGVIACGRMSRAHGAAYRSDPRIDLVACADINSQAAESFGDQFSIPPENRYTDYKQMLERERLDFISICSLHHQHAFMTIDAARSKPKAILCEKPIALSLGEADAMIQACRDAGALLIIGHQRRFSSQYVAAFRALEAGEIGELQVIETHGHPGCSLLVDGTHTVDLIRWYAGEMPIEWVMGQVDAREGRSAWGSQVENAALALFKFSTGVRAFMTLGHLLSSVTPGKRDPLWQWDISPHTYHQIILRGTAGEIHIDGDRPVEGRPWVRLIRNGRVDEIPPANLGKSPHGLLIDRMIHSVETGEPHTLDASSARATLEVLIAVYESSRRRGIVELPLNISENPLFEMIERKRGG